MLTINNLKDVLKIEETPLEQHIQGKQTTYAVISQASEKFKDRAALIFLPPGNPLADLEQQQVKSVYSYQELLTGIQQTINLLLDLGVQKGEVISYILVNTIENYFVLYAAQAVGIANPISSVLPPEELLQLLQTAESKILITLGEHLNPQLWENILKIRHQCPKLEKIIVIGGSENPEQGIFDFHQLQMQQNQPLKLDVRQIGPEDICSYFHTSGTTEAPKLAMHTHEGSAYMAWVMGIFTEYAKPDTVVLSGLPMFHVGAPMVSGLAAFYYGATVVVMSPTGWFDPQVTASFWKIVEKYRGTSFTARSLTFRSLNQIPVNGVDIRSLRQAISSWPVSAHDFETFKKKTGIKIANLWGQTEVTSIGTFNPAVDPDNSHFGSMGFRLPFEQLKVVRLNSRGEYLRDCTIGEPGLLCVNGPNVKGYKNNALNQLAFVQKNWFNTRDWVYQEADGYLIFLGRNEDFIQHSNQFISLLDIERTACEHPEIAEAAAIGVKDPLHDMEIPILFFTLKANAHLTSSQLHNWLKMQSRLSADALPRQVMLCQTLPKNGTGKPLKYILKKQFEDAQAAPA